MWTHYPYREMGSAALSMVVSKEKDGSFFHVCLYPGPKDCSELGAATNVQGQNMGGGSFVHVEANQDVVGDRTRGVQLAVTIADTMQ
jgi:hypothetical protein